MDTGHWKQKAFKTVTSYRLFCLVLGLKVIFHFGVELLNALAKHVSWAALSTQIYNGFTKLWRCFLNYLDNKKKQVINIHFTIRYLKSWQSKHFIKGIAFVLTLRLPYYLTTDNFWQKNNFVTLLHFVALSWNEDTVLLQVLKYIDNKVILNLIWFSSGLLSKEK